MNFSMLLSMAAAIIVGGLVASGLAALFGYVNTVLGAVL